MATISGKARRALGGMRDRLLRGAALALVLSLPGFGAAAQSPAPAPDSPWSRQIPTAEDPKPDLR